MYRHKRWNTYIANIPHQSPVIAKAAEPGSDEIKVCEKLWEYTLSASVKIAKDGASASLGCHGKRRNFITCLLSCSSWAFLSEPSRASSKAAYTPSMLSRVSILLSKSRKFFSYSHYFCCLLRGLHRGRHGANLSETICRPAPVAASSTHGHPFASSLRFAVAFPLTVADDGSGCSWLICTRS